MKLTKKQKEFLGYVSRYVDEWGQSPSFEEICAHFGFNSYNTVTTYLKILERKGYRPKEEYPIGKGETIDLAIIGKRKMAIEVETGKSDAMGNIKKCLKAGFEVLSIAKDANVLGNIRSKIDHLPISDRQRVRARRI